jgi:penicillin-binding protein 1C
VVVVDHRTRDVVALAVRGTDIPMFDRRRSPGSTLKPLLYALAIDRGLALPQFLVADVPSQYGSYRPRNFDGDWAGLVTLRDALGRSLNLPFIELLEEFGVTKFASELTRLGVHALAPKQLGLSMIVGGVELTPLELAGMYATLAENGGSRPLRFAMADFASPTQPSFGAGAAYLTRDALAQHDRPDISHRRDVPPAIHWKTGTSYGSRDAWSAGSGPIYTAVVWAGNVDERPSADLVGSEAAAPLLFDVLEALGTAGLAEAVPDELAEVEVCAYSGHLPTAACHDRVKVRAPIHSIPTTTCPYHQAFDVDRETHKAVSPACRAPGRDYARETFVVLPSSVVSWLVARNRAVPAAPDMDPACAVDFGPPAIVSPAEGATVSLLPGVPTKSQAVPLAASTRAAGVSWFVDGALVGTGASSERMYWTPTVGQHEVVVADDSGRKARRMLVVRQGHR